MIEQPRGFDTYNAKRMTAWQVADSFVPPSMYWDLISEDHCFVVGPRGSGKTTLFRMLQGEGLTAWRSDRAEEARLAVSYSTIFLPADELWANQATGQNAKSAFIWQMLYSLVETMIYRTSTEDGVGNPVHLPAVLAPRDEALLVEECASAWGLGKVRPSLIGLQSAIDKKLLELGEQEFSDGSFPSGALLYVAAGVRAFNRLAGQSAHKWAILLDEMELAPPEIYSEVIGSVRGGPAEIIIKLSMSPYDQPDSPASGRTSPPLAGHDFRAIHLSGMSARETRALTEGLWREGLKTRGLRVVSMKDALGTGYLRTSSSEQMGTVISLAAEEDLGLRSWLESRKFSTRDLSSLTYHERSATVRKIYTLVKFRSSFLYFRGGMPVRRSRKKVVEPFTGVLAVTAALEGNPRWIKSTLSDMYRYFDESSGTVAVGFQFDALVGLEARFEALLRVLPQRSGLRSGYSVPSLVDAVGGFFSDRHLGQFTPDPVTSFVVDRNTPTEIIDAVKLGLYAGAFVHIRRKDSPPVLTDLSGERFRLAYLLGLRDGGQFPLRLGKSISLSRLLILADPPERMDRDSIQLELDL